MDQNDDPMLDGSYPMTNCGAHLLEVAQNKLQVASRERVTTRELSFVPILSILGLSCHDGVDQVDT